MDIKKLLGGVCAGLLMMGCAESETQYTINGVWPEGDGETVYLKKSIGKHESVVLDSAVVVNGRYKMQKPLVEVGERILTIGKTSNFIMLDSVPITVTTQRSMRKNKSGKEVAKLVSEIKGSIEQEMMQKVFEVQATEMIAQMALAFKAKDAQLSEDDPDVKNFVAATQNRKFVMDSLVENYPDAYASALIITRFLSKSKSYPVLLELYSHLSKRVQNSTVGKELKEVLDDMKSTIVGSEAPDFTLTTIDGQELSLKDLRGQYVLLDFWASWCGPCKGEIPNMKQIYDTYHDKGFEILSVSLDDKEEAWKGAVEKEGLNWKHVSSLKGWKCEVAAKYHVSGIPAMFLLDKQGKIIATNLRGEGLQKAVADLFE